MKKTIVILFAVLIISVGLRAQTPKEIVKKCVQALGGETAVKKHLDYSIEGERKIFYGTRSADYKYKEIKKNTKELKRYDRVDGSQGIIFHIFNGEDAWIDYAGNIMARPALNYETGQAHSIALLLEKDASFSPVKETEIGGKKVLGIDVDFKGKKTAFFFDADTYLPVEIGYKDIMIGSSRLEENTETKTRYMDYKTFDGVLFPSKMVVYMDGKKTAEIYIQKVVFNPEVPPDTFIRPVQEMDFRTRAERLH